MIEFVTMWVVCDSVRHSAVVYDSEIRDSATFGIKSSSNCVFKRVFNLGDIHCSTCSFAV